jgi:hypothetical protein
MRTRRAWLIVLAVAGVLGLVPAAASAGPANDAEVWASEFTVPNGGGNGATSLCDDGQRVTGGGAGFDGSSTSARTEQTAPLDESPALTETGDAPTTWRAFASANDGVAWNWKVFAICSSSTDATVQATTFDVAQNFSGHAAAQCPSGQRALGGGVNTTTGGEAKFNYSILASGPTNRSGTFAKTGTGDIARSWVATIGNYSLGDQMFRVYALCSSDSHARVVAEAYSVKPGKIGKAGANCPASSRITGGGLGRDQVPGPMSVPFDLLTTAPLDETNTIAGTDDHDVARKWRTSVYNNSSHRKSFKTFAICEPD